MNNLDIKKFRQKHNLTQQGLASILNVSMGAVRKWEAGTNNIPAPTITLLELYDKEGLPEPANNNTGMAGVSQKDQQINELIQLLKAKDEQIKELTGKLLELASTIIKN